MTVDWGKVLEQTIGVGIGGGLTLAGIWVKELIDRRRDSQSWFEETYITNGIDRALTYVKTVELHLITFRTLTELSKIEEQPLQPQLETRYRLEPDERFPFDSLISLGLLLNSNELIVTTEEFRVIPLLFSDLPADKRSLSHLDDSLNDLRQVMPLFRGLREELLRLRIKRKSDIYRIRENEKVQAITRAFKALDDELGLRDEELRGSSSRAK